MPTITRIYPPAQPDPGLAVWLPSSESNLIVHQTPSGEAVLLRMPAAEMRETLHLLTEPVYLAQLDGLPCLACEVRPHVPAATLPAGWKMASVRSLFEELDAPLYALAGYALQILHWQRSGRYCSTCGHALEAAAGSWARRCPSCNARGYPPITPAILILVHDGGERILLTHKPGWGSRYSIIAGFVEPGESLEECVHREVAEEVGLALHADLRYAGSQSWPYPNQLMVGFIGRYCSGTLQLASELDDARWFPLDALPELPPRLSLSRQIIDQWASECLHQAP